MDAHLEMGIHVHCIISSAEAGWVHRPPFRDHTNRSRKIPSRSHGLGGRPFLPMKVLWLLLGARSTVCTWGSHQDCAHGTRRGHPPSHCSSSGSIASCETMTSPFCKHVTILLFWILKMMPYLQVLMCSFQCNTCSTVVTRDPVPVFALGA